MPRTYVINALKPRGGAYMSYYLGLLLQQEFGYELMNVEVKDAPENKQFHYEILPPSIPLRQLKGSIKDDDLLLVNPSYSSLMLGLNTRGRKICYVQDFRTFRILDGYFDLYVSVSKTVQIFLQHIYGIDTKIIPAFVEFRRLPQVIPWHERPANAAMIYIKSGDQNEAAASYLIEQLRQRLPQLDLRVFRNNGIDHDIFLSEMGKLRYLINVSLAEGFGLVPLEAMALGTCVTGFNGIAGKDFMRFGENSMAHDYHEIDKIAPTLERMLVDETAMRALSENAAEQAKAYSLKHFRQAWRTALADFLPA